MDSRLQRSKLIKKVEDFKTYGVPSSLVGEEGEGGETKQDGVEDYDDRDSVMGEDDEDDYGARK